MIYFHTDTNLHDPDSEFGGNAMRPYPETPARISSILDELSAHSIPLKEVDIHGVDPIKRIHDEDYVEFISSIPDNLSAVAPTVINRGGNIFQKSSFSAKLGHYFFDPATPIMGGTKQAAFRSVDTAMSAVESLLRGANWSVALTRPPGHHANAHQGGGYCIFNNVACAAQYLVDNNKNVTILDLDYHHGNGTQDIFYSTDKVQYISIHADPINNYPFYWGFEEQTGNGDGTGFTINYPVENTTNDETYEEFFKKALAEIVNYNPDVVLVSMGFDAYFKDPIAGMNISDGYYRNIGEELQQFEKLGLFLEGGYHTKDLGKCFYNLYRGISS